MEYKEADIGQAEQIYTLVHKTILEVYPNYYPAKVVDFFCALHSREHIGEDIERGKVRILFIGDKLVGTGSRSENHITRVYVDPDFQGKGCGSCIMQHLEDEIAAEYDAVLLDASLPTCMMYEKRGYQTVKHEKHALPGGEVLVYEVLEKKL